MKYKYIYLFSYFTAFSINIPNNLLYESPVFSNNLGYILIFVNPGIVFISFKYILFSLSKKKSIREISFPSIILKAFLAIFFISISTFFEISAGIIHLDSLLLYLES